VIFLFSGFMKVGGGGGGGEGIAIPAFVSNFHHIVFTLLKLITHISWVGR